MREMKNKTSRRRRGNSLRSSSFSRLFSLSLAVWCFLCHLCFSRLCFRGMGCCPPSSFSLRSCFRQFFGCYIHFSSSLRHFKNTEGRYLYWVDGRKKWNEKLTLFISHSSNVIARVIFEKKREEKKKKKKKKKKPLRWRRKKLSRIFAFFLRTLASFFDHRRGTPGAVSRRLDLGRWR